jgi:hypothetical protein
LQWSGDLRARGRGVMQRSLARAPVSATAKNAKSVASGNIGSAMYRPMVNDTEIRADNLRIEIAVPPHGAPEPEM